MSYIASPNYKISEVLQGIPISHSRYQRYGIVSKLVNIIIKDGKVNNVGKLVTNVIYVLLVVVFP